MNKTGDFLFESEDQVCYEQAYNLIILNKIKYK